MGRAVEATPAFRIEASAILVKKRGRGIEEGSRHRRSWFSSMSCSLCGAGADVAVEREVPAAGAGDGEA